MEYYRDDLKIEFRAVQFTSSSHVLEWRISPEQDLTYEKEYSILGIKFTRKKKFNTDWHRPSLFWERFSYVYINESENYHPIFIENRKELIEYKNRFSTVGEFISWKDKKIDKAYQNWSAEKAKYLETTGTWT